MHQRIVINEPLPAQVLVQHLLATGFTNRALGQAVGLSQPAISRLSRGKAGETSSVSFQKLLRLAGGSIEIPFGVVAGCPPEQTKAEVSNAD